MSVPEMTQLICTLFSQLTLVSNIEGTSTGTCFVTMAGETFKIMVEKIEEESTNGK